MKYLIFLLMIVIASSLFSEQINVVAEVFTIDPGC